MVIRAPYGRESVDVAVVSWNSWHYLRQNLPALIAQDYPAYRVVIVDNASADATADEVEARFPDVEVIRNGRNDGFGGANNLAFERSDSEYVAVLNPDARPEAGWLRALVQALERSPRAAFATSKVLLASDERRVNACGTSVHLSGIGSCRGMGDDQHEHVLPASVPCISGAAFVARREALEEIGGFDERFFMYMEDVELSMRARLAGYDVVLAPRSRVVHDYTPSLPAWKFYYLERNRYFMLANIFRLRTLALLAPALLLAEAGVWWYALRAGPAISWAKARSYAGVVRGIPSTVRRRRRVQAIRRVRDRELLDVMSAAIPLAPGVGRGAVVRLVDRCFGAYGRLLRWAVRW